MSGDNGTSEGVADLDAMSDHAKAKLIQQLIGSMKNPDTAVFGMVQVRPDDAERAERLVLQHGPQLLLVALADIGKSIVKLPILEDYKKQTTPVILQPNQVPPGLRGLPRG